MFRNSTRCLLECYLFRDITIGAYVCNVMLHGGFATAAAMKKPSTEVKTSTSLLHTVYSGTYVQENHHQLCPNTCTSFSRAKNERLPLQAKGFNCIDSYLYLQHTLVRFHCRIDMWSTPSSLCEKYS